MREKKSGYLKITTRITGGAGLLLILLFVTWRIADARRFQLFGSIVSRATVPDSLIALTFDDGPNPTYAEFVLETLERHDVQATFFIIGSELTKYPEFGQQLVAAGHELGNHSYSHARMILKSPGFIRREIETTDSLIRAAGYNGPIYFRPPYCKKLLTLPFYLARHHRTAVTWDLEPESFPEINKHADRIEDYILTKVRPGSIILLHPWYGAQASRDALEKVIRELQGRGYRFVTVSRLLEQAGS